MQLSNIAKRTQLHRSLIGNSEMIRKNKDLDYTELIINMKIILATLITLAIA